MRQSRPLRLAATVIVALLLTSCSADADPEPKFAEPTAESTPAAEPEEPPEEDPTRSPKALIRHWNDLQNAMQLDGDTAAWRELTSSCEGCLSFADQVDEIYANGGFIETDGLRIESIERDPEFSAPTVFRVHVNSAPTEYRSSVDGPVETFPGGQATYRFYLDTDGASWSLRDYARLAQ